MELLSARKTEPATATEMTSEKPKRGCVGKRYEKKAALRDSTGQTLSQRQPANHIKSSSTTRRTEYPTADKLVTESKQINTVSDVDPAPCKRHQRSHWRKRKKAIPGYNNKTTDLKPPELEEFSVPVVSPKAVLIVTGAKTSELNSITPCRFQESLNFHNRSAISPPSQKTSELDRPTCQQQLPYLLRQESSDTVTIPAALPSTHPNIFSGSLNLAGPRFIHGEGVVTFPSINLRTKIACTIDPIGLVLLATLPLIRTDLTSNKDLQLALSTSASTASSSVSTAIATLKAEQTSTGCASNLVREVSTLEPAISKHSRDLSAMPGLLMQPEEKGVQRNGGLDTEISRREFLDKVRPGVDALREKYGRPAADLSTTTNQANNASSSANPTSTKSLCLHGDTIMSAQEDSTTDLRISGPVANINASGLNGEAPSNPIESKQPTNAQCKLSIVPLESMEIKQPLNVEPAPKLKPMPLAENAMSRNKTVKEQIRSDKSMYVPPRLVSLAENAIPHNKNVKEQTRSNKSMYVPPHLRHSMDGGAVKPVPSTYEKPNGNNEQVNAFVPRDTIAPSNAGNSHSQSIVPSKALPSKTIPPKALGENQEMASVKVDNQPVATTKEKDLDEVFVPPPRKPHTPKVLPPPSIEHLLPPHLRNLPRPRLMGLQVKQNAERAAKYVPLDDETIAKQVLSRNEASYKPIVELKATSKLVQELAPDEEVGNTNVAEDNSTSGNSRHSHKNSVESASLQARQEKRWRWFNQAAQASDINGDAEAGNEGLKHELADWDGKWASAPRYWDVRPQFDGYSKAHQVHMEAWIADRVHEAMNMPFKVDTADRDWRSGVLPASGTRKQWQVYPPDCIMDIVPLEYGPVEHPPELPPNDPYSHVKERREQCSAISSKKYVREYKALKRQRQDEKYFIRIELEEMKAAAARRRVLEGPKANIYVRPAEVRDIPQLTMIYNHYVKNTVHAIELAETDNAEWQDRFNRAETERLAFLVAVSKGSKRDSKAKPDGRGNERRGRGNFGRRGRVNLDVNHSTHQEIIFGFVYAEEHAGRQTMFGHVAEVQVFVDPKHHRLGIGKTLVDRIMASLDNGYGSKDYADFVPDNRMIYDVGGSREIHKILINVGFHIGDEKEFEWRKKWLEEAWDFDHIGTISCMGKKFGKGVNVAQMVKETGQSHGMSTWYKEEPFRIPHRERLLREQEAAQPTGEW